MELDKPVERPAERRGTRAPHHPLQDAWWERDPCLPELSSFLLWAWASPELDHEGSGACTVDVHLNFGAGFHLDGA